jgi:predicted ATP-binding protein involved in virulence
MPSVKGLVGDQDHVASLPNEAKIFLNAIVYKKVFRYSAKTKTQPESTVPVAAYGVSRFSILSLGQEESDLSNESTYSLFHDNGQLMNIERLLIDSERDDKPLFNKLKSIFKAIIPSLADIQSKKENKVRRIRYQEKSENGDTYEPVLLSELAAGYRGILTMIGDMVMRLYEDKNNKLDDLKGIVLIDEIDAHLHPKYQYELPYLLSKVFPKVQFIVTTHSPFPILGLPKNIKPVILTVERNLEDGITIDRKDDDFDIRKLNPEALLTSPIFNFQTLFARDATADEIIPTSDFNEVLELEQIKKELTEMRKKGLVK